MSEWAATSIPLIRRLLNAPLPRGVFFKKEEQIMNNTIRITVVTAVAGAMIVGGIACATVKNVGNIN